MKKIILTVFILTTFLTTAGYSASRIGFTAFSTSSFQEDIDPNELGWIGLSIKLDSITLKPGILVYSGDTENKDIDSSTTTTEKSSTFGFTMGLFYNFNPEGRLQVSLGPVFSLINATKTDDNGPTSSTTEITYKEMIISLNLCVEYFINKHISLFMEIGAGLSDYNYHYKSTSNATSTVTSDYDRPYSQISTLAGIIGVAIYL